MIVRTADDYLSLITSQHKIRPKFAATVSATVSPLCALQSVLQSMPKQYDVDDAVGKQLDAVGEWVGSSRYIDTPLLDVYFTWDDMTSTGWDAGIWQGPFDPDSGLTTLPDDAYRLLIKAKIAANHWDGSIPGAYAVWESVFPDSYIVIQDNQNMTMVIGIAGLRLDTVSQALLTGGYIPLKPQGVGVEYYAISTNDGPLFAWDSDTPALAGWDTGSWAQELSPT